MKETPFRAVETREKREGWIHVGGDGSLCGTKLHATETEAQNCQAEQAAFGVRCDQAHVRYTRRVWIHVDGRGLRCGATHASEAERDACARHPREAAT